MSIAKQILAKVENAQAVTLEGGYAVLAGGVRNLFPPGKIIEIKRNLEARCTFVVAQYEDGSQIHFRWSESRGPQYKAIS